VSRRRTSTGSTAGAVVVLLLGLLVWWLQGGLDAAPDRSGDPAAGAHPGGDHSARAHPAGTPGAGTPGAGAPTDPASGLPWIAEDALPGEARDTLRLIDAGGPYPEHEDDQTFGNFEGILPDEPRGYYREYTVHTPGVESRGARRIVTGDGGEYYWTADHYQSFSRIQR
jgi:ribonuclease T1